MSQRREGASDIGLRYERRPPATSCSRCQRPLWPEDISRIAWERQSALSTAGPRLIRECADCHRVPAGALEP